MTTVVRRPPNSQRFRNTLAVELLCQGATPYDVAKDWATVAKVVKSGEMEATVMEMRGSIIGTWKEWLASLRRAVNLENDAQIAKFLFTAFEAIPAAPPKVEVQKTVNNQQSK